MTKVEFKKAEAAVKSYVLYTGDKPASWDVLVDGVHRAHISGYCPGYSRTVFWQVKVDGVEQRAIRHGRLKDVKRAIVHLFTVGVLS